MFEKAEFLSLDSRERYDIIVHGAALQARRMRVLRYRLLMKVFATVTRNVISAIVWNVRA